MGKQIFRIWDNKGADQLRSDCEADQRHCFRYADNTIALLSMHLAIVCACVARFVSDPFGNHIVCFLMTRLICYHTFLKYCVFERASEGF